MKIVFSIILSLLFYSAISQKKDSLKLNPSAFKIDKNFIVRSPSTNLSIPDLSVWNVIYKNKMEQSYRFKMPIAYAYSYSTTIFDETEIILFDSSIFFAFHIDCSERLCTAGYYNKDATFYSFTSSKNAYNSIKLRLEQYFKDFVFTDFKTKVFYEQANQLIYFGSN